MNTSMSKPVRVGYKSSNSNDVWMSSSWLEHILSKTELKDCKLAIVGIVGDSNSGKSFLMNILAEYLRCEEVGSHGWMESIVKTKNLTGFALHENRKRCDNFFEGVYMWPRPFILKKPCDENAEEKVVVLLLDIDMDEISPGMEILMCILCSTLIYNKTASDSPDISTILKLRNSILSCDTSFKNIRPSDVVFQQMMVVFRDFSYTEDSKFKYGKDKLDYLSKVMQMETNMTWKEDFDKIPSKNCFLMKRPDPPIFGKDGQFQLEDKRFIWQLKSLTEYILTIDDLPLKTVKGSRISLNSIKIIERMDFLIPDIVNSFHNLPQPDFQTKLEKPTGTKDETKKSMGNEMQDSCLDSCDLEEVKNVITGKLDSEFQFLSRKRTESTKASQQCFDAAINDVVFPRIMNFYNQEMKAATENPISMVELQEAHKKIKEECFNSVKKACSFDDYICSEIQSQTLFKEVEVMLNKYFEIYSESNQTKLDEAMSRVQLKINKSRVHYIDLMKMKIRHRGLSPQEFEQRHKESLDAASTLLKMELILIDEDPKLHMSNLVAKIKSELDSFTEENLRRLKEEEILKQGQKKRETIEIDVADQRKRSEGQNSKSNLLLVKDGLSDEDPKLQMSNLVSKMKSEFDSFTEENVRRRKEKEILKQEQKKRETIEIEKFVADQRERSEEPNSKYSMVQTSVSANQFIPNGNLQRTTTASATTTSSVKKETIPLTIAVEFGMKAVKCGIMLNGELKIIPDRWGNLEFPGSVAVTVNDEILIGHEVLSRQFPDLKCAIHLTETLLAPSDKLLETPFKPILFKGELWNLSKEFLCGLILSRVKCDAEKFLNATVDSVVITVPLWYSSSQRQATKDAATIGGFSSVNLINEPSAVALSYFKGNYEVIRQSNTLLVLIANNDYQVDVAFYECNLGNVQMISCAGNLHHAIPGFLKEFQYWLKNKLLGETRKRFIRSLIKECVEWRQISQYVLICDQDKYDEMQKVIGELTDGRETRKPDKAFAILYGAAIFAQLRSIDKTTARSYISDRLPYRIDYTRSNEHGKYARICRRHQALPLKELILTCDFQSMEHLQFKVVECGNEETFTTGYLEVPVLSNGKDKRSIRVNFWLNCEGILKVTANYMDRPSEQEIRIHYNTFNICQDYVAMYASLVCSLHPNPKIEEDKRMLEISKNELRTLAQLLQNNLHRVTSICGKDQMQKRANEAMQTLAHPKITQEDVNNKTAVLTKLKTKYL